MDSKAQGRRNWIKNIAIIFLVILLLLTFFSNTILNYSLPEVSAQYPQYAQITSAVKASGVVKANAAYNVVYEDIPDDENYSPTTRRITSVYVREGDVVTIDSPIIALQGGPSQELSSLQEQYDALKIEYDLALLNEKTTGLYNSKEISDINDNIKKCKEELNKLEAEYKALKNGTDPTTEIEAKIESIEDTIESLNDKIESINDTISDNQEQLSEVEGKIQNIKAILNDNPSVKSFYEQLTEAQAKFDELKTDYEIAEREYNFTKEYYEELTNSNGDVAEANSLTNEIKALEESLESEKKEYTRAEEDHEKRRREISDEIGKILHDSAESRYEVLSDMIEGGVEDGDFEEGGDIPGASMTVDYESMLDEAGKRLEEEDDAFKRTAEDYEERINKLKAQINDLYSKLAVLGMPEINDVQNYATDKEFTAAQKDYETAEAKYNELKGEYDETEALIKELSEKVSSSGMLSQYESLSNSYTSTIKKLETQIKDINKQIKDYNKQIESLQRDLNEYESKYKDPEDVLEQINSQKEQIKEYESQLEIKGAELEYDTASKNNDMEAKKKELLKLENQIKAYSEAPETTLVTAPVAGRITAVNYVAGESVSSGDTVAMIEISDKGYICELTLSSEEARKISTSSEVSISNSWWYSNVNASISQIRADPSSGGKNRIVVLQLSGDVSEGQSLKFTIGEKSQYFESVLPNSAIREDNDGKFVLVVDSKTTPLGVRYTARRQEIEIVTSDETKTAVNGLYGSEFVITGSTTPISDKQQVRLSD